MLIVMLEKHGIEAFQEYADPTETEDDLGRVTQVFVAESDYDRAFQLFYAERQDEL